MVCCASRTLMITVCSIQLILTVQRQLFDFLGYMWAPIIGNFFQIIFVIFGLFGVYQYRPKYVATYVLWTTIWIAWNIFMLCFYLEIGFLNREQSYLNLGTGSRSWFEINGIGCKALYEPHTPDELAGFTKPASVDGCLLDYYYVEAIQAISQLLLAVIALFGGTFVIYTYTQEDPSSVRRKRVLGHHRASVVSLPYSIEYHHVNSKLNFSNNSNTHTMRSNGNSVPNSTNSSRRNHKRRSARSNRSQRASYQNPVTKLMDKYVDTSSQDSYNHLAEYLKSNNSINGIPGSSGIGANSSLPGYPQSNQTHTSMINGNTSTYANANGMAGQVNAAYEQTSRYSIASSGGTGTYGVVDNFPAPPYSLLPPPHPVTSTPHGSHHVDHNETSM